MSGSMGTNMCLFFKRRFTITEAKPPRDVKEAFNKYAEGGSQMTAEQLRWFLVEVQGEKDASISDAEGVVEQVNQDMTAPLSHYFIYTGHNSYLTGNQLNSDCSVLPIIKALERGVRVVELDLWPDDMQKMVFVFVMDAKDCMCTISKLFSYYIAALDCLLLYKSLPSNQNALNWAFSSLSPRSMHMTLTDPVEPIECFQAIEKHAFSASPYPVVITIEDHLTPELQAKVAQMITKTFQDVLFYPQSECSKEFRSPEDLKNRIIISTKPPKEYLQAQSGKEKGHNLQKGKASDEQDMVQWDDESHPPGECTYKSLIAIPAGKPKGGLKEALKVEINKVRRLSLSEHALEKAASSHGMDVVRFTQRNFLRGYGKHLWLMHGMFRSNGGCGYVRKPDLLMKVGPDNHVFDPKANLQVKTTLKVNVYIGDGWHSDFKETDFDMFSPPDFYTRVGIAGVPADKIMKETKIIYDNWTPVWNEEFTFPLTVPELALLRVEVQEYDMAGKSDFGGQSCLPVWELRPGIRAVPLFNNKGDKYNSVRLLMRFEFV
ncbi:Phosphoinositide phospholipase C 2 [Morella rubra]|uniref:Phosphoinositide phospholipase C n=1 Tax=Morella rubra TaxID=262757 RepID=A0A6A1ULS4_9ROSI|nr:Phosphoinositide phospholipase C 2 [Morella rubra]